MTNYHVVLNDYLKSGESSSKYYSRVVSGRNLQQYFLIETSGARVYASTDPYRLITVCPSDLDFDYNTFLTGLNDPMNELKTHLWDPSEPKCIRPQTGR